MASESEDIDPIPAGMNVTPRRTGTALAVIGALLLGLGIFTSTGATVQPRCPDGTTLVAKFTNTGPRFRFDEPRGNSRVVTLSRTSATGGQFNSTRPIAAIVVKGGPGSKDTFITPASRTGSFSNAGLPTSSGATPNIETVQFCVTTAVNPAAAAAGFDVVTKGDAVLAANGSEGPVAIGGDVRFDQYRVATHSAGSYKVDPADARPTSLLVRGKASVSNSRGQLTAEVGWVAVGNPSGVKAKRSSPDQIVVSSTSAKVDKLPRILGQTSAQSLSSATRRSSFDFDGTFKDWQQLADGLARCTATVKLSGSVAGNSPWTGGDAFIDPPSGSGQMVLELTADDLARLTSITFRAGAEPTSARPLVIDVAAVPRDWNPPHITGDADGFAPYILWNFGHASKVGIHGGADLVGTAFAPSGAVDRDGDGNLVGAVYAATFVHDGGGDVHDRPFATTVVPCSCTPPSPTTSSTVYPTTTTGPTTTVRPTSSTTTSSTTTSTVYPTSTSAPTTTIRPTSTTSPSTTTSSSSTTSSTTTSSTTTSTVYPTTTTAPTTTTTPTSTTSPPTTEAPTTTDRPTTTTGPTTTGPTTSTTTPGSTTTTAEVADTTVVATSITPDDNARVEGTSAEKGTGLAFTGSSSLPLVVLGGLLLLAGVTTVLVDRRRRTTTKLDRS